MMNPGGYVETKKYVQLWPDDQNNGDRDEEESEGGAREDPEERGEVERHRLRLDLRW